MLPVSNPPSQEKIDAYYKLKALVSEKRRRVCSRSFRKFIEFYLPHLMSAKTPPFHFEMMDLMEKLVIEGVSPERLERLLFIAPRGFAKSTLCSVMFPLWLALFNKRHDIFLVSATISLAMEQMRKIRNEIEGNQTILDDFGELKSDKWTENTLILANRVVIRAKGRGFQIRGFRPDAIICDDLEDEEVIYSKEQRDKLEVWFLRTLLPALKPGQFVLYVGTKLHQFSLINKLQEKEEFTSRLYRALVDEQSIWEDLWPTDRLNKLRRELGEYAFQAEYQNNPISLEEQPVKPYMIDGIKIPGEPEFSCLAIDPAISEKEGSDYRAFTIFARTPDGFREIFSERGKWGIEEQIDRAIDLYERFKPSRVIIEAVAFQKVYKPLLLKRSREKKIWIPVSEAELGTGDDKRPRDKFTRLLSVVHLFEQQLVQVTNPDLREELLAFPHGDHDDLVDATVYALYWLMNLRQGAVTQTKVPMDAKAVFNAKPSFYLKEIRPGVWIQEAGDPPMPKRSNFINVDKPI